MKTKDMVLCAVFAAVLCVLAVITIPIGPVPITLGTLGVMLTASILGAKKGTVSVLVYILLGAIGLPVFSGFHGGFQVIAGPTGGYITAYIFMALFIGIFTKKLPTNKLLAMGKIALFCFIGVIICYFLGTLQFMFVQNTGFVKSLGICVFPFIPFDAAKAVVAGYLAYVLRKALAKIGKEQ